MPHFGDPDLHPQSRPMPLVRTSRSLLPLLILLTLTACVGAGGGLSAGPEPRSARRYLPEGAMVRVRLIDGATVTGPLMAPFHYGDDLLLLCERASAPCAGPDAPGARRVGAASLRTVHVWGRQTGYYARLGLYAGALGGLAAGEDDDGLLLVAGGFAVGALGAGIGSQVNGWTPVIPCLHVCGWETKPVEESAPAP
jgi:hypothetical protein